MDWSDVGNWIKNNAGAGAALVGSLVTGNVPGAVAAGQALISSATGTDDPAKAMKTLQSDPESVIRLRELANKEEQSIRKHIEEMRRLELEDKQDRHRETQKTIRGGDVSTDEYVRRTRPQMARQSWAATVAYCLGALLVHAFNDSDIFNIAIAGVLSAPAWAYLGLRTGDKFAGALKSRKEEV